MSRKRNAAAGATGGHRGRHADGKTTAASRRPVDGARPLRRLVIVLGDQLDPAATAFDNFDPRQDAVWMAEVTGEIEFVWSHQVRLAYFLSAMRHFRDELRARSWHVHYRQLDAQSKKSTLEAALAADLRRLAPEALVVTHPGEWRVLESLKRVAKKHGLPLEVRPDRHFLCSLEEFTEHARGRKQLRQEFFYREMRTRLGVLLEDGRPAGGRWNLDPENRGAFPASGPGRLRPPRAFAPDGITREVFGLIEERFASHPGSLGTFDWPVTRAQAQEALADFVTHRLARFGTYQDAMWTSEPFLYHARLSAPLNLKLLSPQEVIDAVEAAYRDRRRRIPLAAAEGFIRQVLGWREYVRGIYWTNMPGYLGHNALRARRPLPAFYWTGETPMHCLAQVIGQTLAHGYAHHIQRLMVTGLFALLWGVQPQEVHAWYLAIYLDAVEWVELPNTLGMSQYADGGLMASKPYAASGKYIDRMSNYCRDCPFRPGEATGPRACPFTTLYWDFLLRHRERLRTNPRMGLQLRNADRLSENDRSAIQRQARRLRRTLPSGV